MATREYKVSLDLFGGPMDLLLYLVRRNEVDILELPLAKIAAQFVDQARIDALRHGVSRADDEEHPSEQEDDA